MTNIEKNALTIEPHALAYLNRVLPQKNAYSISEAYKYLGRINYHLKKYSKANQYYDQAIKAIKKQHAIYPKELVFLLKQKGQSFLDTQQIDSSYHYYSRALDTIHKYRLNDLKVSIQANIAMIKSEISDFKEALKLHQNNLQFLKNINPENYTSYNKYDVEYIATLLNIATAHRRLKNLDSANIYNAAALQRNQQVLNQTLAPQVKSIQHKLKGHLLTNQGIIAFHQKLFDESLQYFSRAKAIQDSLNIHSFSLECDLFKGKNYLMKKEYDTAIYFGKKAIKGFEKKYQFSSTRNLLDAYLLLSNCYEKIEDYKHANFYYEKYRQRYEQVLDPQKIHVLNTIENEYKSSFLRKSNKILEKKSSLLLGIALLLILLLLGGYLFHRRKIIKNKRVFEELMLKIKNLEAHKEQKTVPKTHSSLQIDEKTVQIILDKLTRLEENHFFLDKSYDLSTTAQKIGTNTSYLSAIINHYKAKNFKEYMNVLKINHALLTLKENTTYRKYAINALATEFGYNSTLTFSRAFKKYSGLNPSEYIQSLNKSI
ncbi:AraC family transcriptional regulator [uncultured Kordia sp.]|uniref:helix-turn-helix domain-containing protein n=1 Tax=uncultured Kordia sp. TaxID=507699 RepID=UPI002616F170|nr:AraC family transcriptional regulator [uncultured Kordia sp.]